MRRTRLSALFPTLAALSLLGAAITASAKPAAAWSHDPYTGNLQVTVSPGAQQNVQTISDDAGGVFLVWEDYRSGNADIYSTHLNAQGLDLVGDVPICSAAGDQTSPRVATDGDGGFIVAWEDSRGPSADIYAQRYDRNGALWAANGVPVCTVDREQSYPAIAANGSGGAIIVWQDRRGADYDLYAQSIDSNGARQWAPVGVPICTAAFDQTYPSIITDAFGTAIIVWQDERGGAGDIYAQRLVGGVPQYANGTPLCTAAGAQRFPVAAADGVSGAIVAWMDERNANRDIYAARMTFSGSMPWTVDGVAVCSASGSQQLPVVTADGTGGAIVAWADNRGGDYDVYTQRLTSGGGAVWTPDGSYICAVTGTQIPRSIVADGVGGAIVVWEDQRYPGPDIYTQRINSSGYGQWTYNGVLVSGAVGDQTLPAAIPDGTGGAIFAWQDGRVDLDLNIYADRVDRFGVLGNAEPHIVKVRDVPNDQGGHVKVWWDASYLDADPYNAIYEYRILRSVPPARAAMALSNGARFVSNAGEDAAPGAKVLYVTQSGAQSYYWELIGTSPTLGVTNYSFVAPTTSDSVGASNPRMVFMIQARSGNSYWNSAPDSGYSVDNLPPVTPAHLAGAPAGASTLLYWDSNGESDLAGYRVYRGNTPAFVPGPATLVAAVTEPNFSDDRIPGVIYKVTAVDIHGNESPYAMVGPLPVLNAPVSDSPAVMFLAPPAPNPAKGSTLFRWGLPAAGRATLEVLDAQGRRVRIIDSGIHPAGTFTARWDGRDDAERRAGDGMYFIRLVTPGRTVSSSLVMLH